MLIPLLAVAFGAEDSPSPSDVTLYDAGLHNRSRNRARDWIHSRIWRSRDYFLSTPPTRKTANVPFLRDCSSSPTTPSPPAEKAAARQDQAPKASPQSARACVPKSHARSATPKTRTMRGSRPRRLEGPRRRISEPKVASDIQSGRPVRCMPHYGRFRPARQ